MKEINFIKKNWRKTRRLMAKTWFDVNLQLKTVGITGSYGKTTTVRTVKEVLSAKYKTIQTDINLDTNFNLPVTLLKIKPWTEALVLEYGIDHLGEMDEHLKLVSPQIAVLTGITPVHTDDTHFKSLSNLINEKRKLTDNVKNEGLSVFNYDDVEVLKIGKEHQGKKVFYGLSPKADIWADDIRIETTQTAFTLHDNNRTRLITTKLLGYPAVYACLVGWIVGRALDVAEDRIISSLKEIKPLRGRLSIEPGPMGITLVNDALRANYASTISGLKSFAEFPGRKVAVLGEMGEIGEMDKDLHRKIGKNINGLKIDSLVGVGPLTKYIIEETRRNNPKIKVFWANGVRPASNILRQNLKPNDLLYLKASLLRHLERIILILNEKKVECVLVSCQRYKPCDSCPLLEKKLN